MTLFFRALVYFMSVMWLVGCATQGKRFSEVAELTPSQDRQINPQLLKEDLAAIRQHLLNIHPQPFARLNVAKFNAQFNRLKQSLNYPLSPREFYLKVAPLLASLKDVHSFVNLPKARFDEFGYRQEQLFPLAVIVEDDDIYVAADLSSKPLVPTGAKLISINQAPVKHLLGVMRSLTARETASGQNRRIQMNFSWLLASMGNQSENYVVDYLWHKQRYTLSLAPIKTTVKQASQTTPHSYYGYTKLTSSTALLWFNDFNEKPEVFEQYLKDQFALMESSGIKNLILDLRFNSGGLLENLKSLLQQISQKPFKWARNGKLKISKALQKNHKAQTQKRRKDKYHWGLQWLPLEWTNALQHKVWWGDSGDFIDLDVASIEPTDGFKPKKMWVLTNGFCYSACSFFAAAINHHKLGKTLGEKPGSLARFQFAYPVTLQLQHSQLKLTLPTMQLNFIDSPLVDLIQPQQVIKRSLSDIETRQDPVLNHALKEANHWLIEELN